MRIEGKILFARYTQHAQNSRESSSTPMPTQLDTANGGSLPTKRDPTKQPTKQVPTTKKSMKPSRHRTSSEIYSRPKKETKMSRHKIAPNEGSQAVALREAMIKLQELELQSTENRVKVGHVQTRVAEFLYHFESSFTGKNAVTPEDYQMFQDELRGKMDDIVSTISENCTSNTKLLSATSESLVQASLSAAAAEREGGDGEGSSGNVKRSESELEQIAEEMSEIFTESTTIRERLESRLLETQGHLTAAHDQEHQAKREVAKMQLQVASSKAEARRVWNEAQEKLKTLKETEMRLHRQKEVTKQLEARAKGE